MWRAWLSQLTKDSEGCTGWGQVFYCCTDLPLILEGLTDDTDYFCNLFKYSSVENLSFHIHVLKYFINILLDLNQRAEHLAKAISVFCSSRYSVKSREGKELSKVYLLWQAGTHHRKQRHQQTKRLFHTAISCWFQTGGKRTAGDKWSCSTPEWGSPAANRWLWLHLYHKHYQHHPPQGLTAAQAPTKPL